MEIQIDVVVIGAGGAGAAASLQLGRVRRSVVVVDAGQPRNAPAKHMHGYVGHDGRSPGEFLAIAHAELAAYGIEIVNGQVVSVVDDGDRVACTTAGGDVFLARRVVLASGLTDVVPDIPGVRDLWGEQVIHCPWCHGWEVKDQRIAVIDTSGMGSHQALVLAQLSDHVTLIRNHPDPLTTEEIERLGFGGVQVETRTATEVVVAGDDLQITLNGGELIADVAVVAPRFEPNASMVEGLIEIGDHLSGMGRHVVVDEVGTTSHPKIFAAGNVADPMQQVLHAASHGSRVATMLNASLIEEDIDRARRAVTDRVEWDERYERHGGEQMWSGEPNGSLVIETRGLVPGRALDVGCGEGADAIWLAVKGWEVTGTDISAVAIGRARAAATAAGVDVAFDAVDAITDPPSAHSYDVVVVSYPAFKRTSGRAVFGSIVDAVSPGGRLVVIGHVHDEAALAAAKEHGIDPDEYVSFDDITNIIGGDFVVEVDDVRTRPDAPIGAHHSLDRVLVAHRSRIGRAATAQVVPRWSSRTEWLAKLRGDETG